MAFQLPEDLTALAPEELENLHAEGLAEARAIAEGSDDLSEDDLANAEAIMAGLAQITTELDSRISAAESRAARINALREALPEAATEEEAVEATDDEATEETPAEPTPAPVVASIARPAPGGISRIARRAPAVIIPEPEAAPKGVTLIAAANVPEYNAGHEFADLGEVSMAFLSRSRSFKAPSQSKPIGAAKGMAVMDTAAPSNVYRLSPQAGRFGIARIQKPENEFTTGADMSLAEQMEVINEVGKESRLPGRALTASGGWCAPSEILYDFCSWETVAGLLSIPEVTIRRGGIQFTKGPDYATLAADWGFLQTEAQAEAGEVKECYAVECPEFEEVRLDAIGFCVTNGLLTNVGYPELVRRVLEIGATAHAHKVNAQVIARISALIGPAVDHAEIGATTSDVLDALALQASRLRYSYSMAPNQTIEAVLPIWAKEIIRADLSRRTGVLTLSISDADINSYLSVRGIAAQWVYDYQPLAATNTGTWTSWPDTLEVMLYPAGAFIKGTADVIDLDVIYDSVGLSTNTYTAAFFEEGLLVANRCGSGVKVSIDVSCLAGNTGAAQVSCLN